jgi:tetratricopeptide (TPR) repeat protein
MATAAQNRQEPVKYSVHAEATNLFKFLTGTFFQMPKPVQVLGWLVFLMLFLYLVLYPILGITYYEGQVETLSFDQQGNRVPSRTQGASIKKGNKVLTNEDGEFTLGVHWPYVPFTSVEFKVEAPGVPPEDISIPAPRPFVSLFNPNLRKIYCVPNSKEADANGLAKRFFLDLKEATNALDKGKLANGPESSLAQPVDSIPTVRPSLIPTVYAAGSISAVRNYTLRLREAKVSGIDRAAKVYLDIRVDGQPFGGDSFPDPSSSELRDLTVFAGSPVHFDSVYLPIPVSVRRVDISMIERKSFYQRDPLIGTVSFALDPKKTGTLLHLTGGNMELTLELLPPASLKCMTVRGKKGNYVAAFWLSIEDEHLGEVDKLQYDFGPNWHIPSAELDAFENYGYLVSTYGPQPVKARVDFTSGSTVNVAAFCDSGNQTVDSSVDHYFLARAYASADDPAAALPEIDKALQGLASLGRAHRLKGSILAKLGRFNEAEGEYKEAIHLAPNVPAVLNSYAWMVADMMPSPQRSQLLDAKGLAERAVQMRPDHMIYDTLGWVEFKLGEYQSALEALRRAESLCTGICRSNSSWQAYEYHLGKLYTALRKEQEANQAFQAVLKFKQEHASISKDEYVQQATAALKTTKQGG